MFHLVIVPPGGRLVPSEVRHVLHDGPPPLGCCLPERTAFLRTTALPSCWRCGRHRCRPTCFKIWFKFARFRPYRDRYKFCSIFWDLQNHYKDDNLAAERSTLSNCIISFLSLKFPPTRWTSNGHMLNIEFWSAEKVEIQRCKSPQIL